jgi:hypothetical protein
MPLDSFAATVLDFHHSFDFATEDSPLWFFVGFGLDSDWREGAVWGTSSIRQGI